jgi:hypothetical protein
MSIARHVVAHIVQEIPKHPGGAALGAAVGTAGALIIGTTVAPALFFCALIGTLLAKDRANKSGFWSR